MSARIVTSFELLHSCGHSSLYDIKLMSFYVLYTCMHAHVAAGSTSAGGLGTDAYLSIVTIVLISVGTSLCCACCFCCACWCCCCFFAPPILKYVKRNERGDKLINAVLVNLIACSRLHVRAFPIRYST